MAAATVLERADFYALLLLLLLLLLLRSCTSIQTSALFLLAHPLPTPVSQLLLVDFSDFPSAAPLYPLYLASKYFQRTLKSMA